MNQEYEYKFNVIKIDIFLTDYAHLDINHFSFTNCK